MLGVEREAFIRRISARLGDAASRGPALELPELPPTVGEDEGLVPLFTRRAAEAGVTVDRVETRADALEAVAGLLAGRGEAATLACPEDLRWPGLGGRWASDPGMATVGLSEADWGIAVTGGVVFRHEGSRGRSCSLLPATVAILLPVSRLRLDLAAVLREVAGLPAPACITFMTGVSHSADIASVTCRGVHGPGEVVLWLIDGE